MTTLEKVQKLVDARQGLARGNRRALALERVGGSALLLAETSTEGWGVQDLAGAVKWEVSSKHFVRKQTQNDMRDKADACNFLQINIFKNYIFAILPRKLKKL